MMLRSNDLWLVTGVSGQPIGHLTLEDGTYRLSRNVVNKPPINAA